MQQNCKNSLNKYLVESMKGVSLIYQTNKKTKAMNTQTFKVTYTKANGNEGTILVKARNEQEAISNAKNCCYTGSDFRNPVVTDEVYTKPSDNGFAGSNKI